jgi:hypothetical protein
MKKLVLAAVASLFFVIGTPLPAYAQSANCDELLRLANVLSAAQEADNNFGYWYQIDQAQQDYYFCLNVATHSGDPADAARECYYAFTSRTEMIESEYTPIRDAALAASIEYYNYLAYIISQQEICNI